MLRAENFLWFAIALPHGRALLWALSLHHGLMKYTVKSRQAAAKLLWPVAPPQDATLRQPRRCRSVVVPLSCDVRKCPCGVILSRNTIHAADYSGMSFVAQEKTTKATVALFFCRVFLGGRRCPSRFSRFKRYFRPLIWCEFFCAGLATFEPTESSQLHRSLILLWRSRFFGFGFVRGFGHESGSELVQVSWAFRLLFHAPSIPNRSSIVNRQQTTFHDYGFSN